VGKLEIPETVLEELLQNALVHADLLKTAAIRLLVFDDRVEIINPGCIMGGHSIEEVMLCNSFARNPLMANFCAKTMPYRGLGSGIPRVLSEDSHVKFIDSKDGNLFTVCIYRVLAEKHNETEIIGCDLARSKTEKARSIGEKAVSKEELLLAFCSEPRSLSEISEFLKLKEKYKMKKKLIDPLLDKSLRMTEPNSPNSPTQKYVIIGNDD
jgi:ATP-dependent DNA helicase RecG